MSALSWWRSLFASPPPEDGDHERVRPVIVRVTRAEWVVLLRAGKGRDPGDVLREWAGLPPIRR
jgi:hypothetical protein